MVGLLFYIEPVLQKHCSFYLRFCFKAFEIYEVRLSYDGHTAVFLGFYHPPPSRQNKLTNAMFLEQFSDLLESYVSCDRFVLFCFCFCFFGGCFVLFFFFGGGGGGL